MPLPCDKSLMYVSCCWSIFGWYHNINIITFLDQYAAITRSNFTKLCNCYIPCWCNLQNTLQQRSSFQYLEGWSWSCSQNVQLSKFQHHAVAVYLCRKTQYQSCQSHLCMTSWRFGVQLSTQVGTDKHSQTLTYYKNIHALLVKSSYYVHWSWGIMIICSPFPETIT